MVLKQYIVVSVLLLRIVAYYSLSQSYVMVKTARTYSTILPGP
jgi:hypothetical protein